MTTANFEGLDDSRRPAAHVSGQKGNSQQNDCSPSFNVHVTLCIAFECALIGSQRPHWITFVAEGEQDASDHAEDVHGSLRFADIKKDEFHKKRNTTEGRSHS